MSDDTQRFAVGDRVSWHGCAGTVLSWHGCAGTVQIHGPTSATPDLALVRLDEPVADVFGPLWSVFTLAVAELERLIEPEPAMPVLHAPTVLPDGRPGYLLCAPPAGLAAGTLEEVNCPECLAILRQPADPELVNALIDATRDPRYPHTCPACGGPCWDATHALGGLLRADRAEHPEGATCPPEVPEPDVHQVVYRNGELVWIADGAGREVFHPIREEAIAAWRRAVAEAGR